MVETQRYPPPNVSTCFYTRRGHIFSNVIASPKLEFDPAVESWAPAFGRLLSWTDASWWLQPLWNILVKMDHFPNSRGEKHKKSVSCHHVVFLLQAFFGGSFKKIGRDHPPKKWAFGEEIEQTSFGDVYIYIYMVEFSKDTLQNLHRLYGSDFHGVVPNFNKTTKSCPSRLKIEPYLFRNPGENNIPQPKETGV